MQVVVPDYSVLLKPSFWLQKDTLSGASAKDKNEAFEVAAKEASKTHGG